MGGKRTWSGTRLRTLREEKNLSREALAYCTENSVATIVRWERGTHAPSANKLAALADFLEVTDLNAFYENGKATA